jgi:hypothetical protein
VGLRKIRWSPTFHLSSLLYADSVALPLMSTIADIDIYPRSTSSIEIRTILLIVPRHLQQIPPAWNLWLAGARLIRSIILLDELSSSSSYTITLFHSFSALSPQSSSQLSPDAQPLYIENRVLSETAVPLLMSISRVTPLKDWFFTARTYNKTVMLSQPAEAARNRTMCLTLMPPEIVTKIFCQLPSFSDVFALSATCHQLRHIWLSNVTPIYTHVGPRSIACETQARKFLIDQGGPVLDCPMSAKDVIRMVQNSRVVEKAIRQFEREIVCRVKSKLK